MNNCGGCKYFGKEIYSGDYFDEDKDEFIENPKYHQCDLLIHLNKDSKWPSAEAGVMDGSGYHATFCVTTDFGCIKWEQK